MSAQDDDINPTSTAEMDQKIQKEETADAIAQVNESDLQVQNEIETKRSSLDGKRITAQRYLRDGSEDEHATRKREREGSLEPTGPHSHEKGGEAPPSSDGVPTKKNRLGDDEEHLDSKHQDSQAERVGHIRQRVQDLTWQEQKEREKELEKTQGKAIPAKETSMNNSESLESPSKKQKQPTFASFSSSSSSPFASSKVPTSNIFASSTSTSTPSSGSSATSEKFITMKDFPTAKSNTPSSSSCKSSNASMDESTPIPAPAKLSSTSTQPTFSSFSSSSSSPFNSKSPAAGPSWLGSNSSPKSSSAFGGIKPSSLGSSISQSNTDHTQSISGSSIFGSTPASSLSPTANAKAKARASPALGFGAFAGSSAFVSSKSNSSFSSPNLSGSSSPALQADETPGEKLQDAGEEVRKAETEDAFSQALSQKDDSGTSTQTAFGTESETTNKSENGAGADKGKGKETASADLTTGEESERTVHSARAKLYVMSNDANNTWKERGVGTIRCNVPKLSMLDRSRGSEKDQSKGARLVMRADGVLRVILNVALFEGMSLELAQDKFVRIVALENGELVHFAIKLANAAAASAFSSAVSAQIPSKERSMGDEIA